MEKLRTEIDDKYKWDLTSLYVTEKEFEEDIKNVQELNNKLVNFKGDSSLIGKIVKVKILDAKTWSLDGEYVK